MHISYTFDIWYNVHFTDWSVLSKSQKRIQGKHRYQLFRHNEVFSLLKSSPTLSFEILLLTSLNLHYPKMLLHNFKFSGRKGLRRSFFSNANKFLMSLDYLSFKDSWSLQFNEFQIPIPIKTLFQLTDRRTHSQENRHKQKEISNLF